jgi:hypothetical protein
VLVSSYGGAAALLRLTVVSREQEDILHIEYSFNMLMNNKANFMPDLCRYGGCAEEMRF